MMMPHLHCLAVEKGHFDIVKHILENTTDFDLSDTGKLPLFLASMFCIVVCYRHSHAFFLHPSQSLTGGSSNHWHCQLLCATVDMVNDNDYDLVSDSLL
jgi:hypothetical protein